MHFKGKVVWITGASSGIGAALSGFYANEGVKLILTSRNQAAMQAWCSRFTDLQCQVLPADLAEGLEAEKLVAAAMKCFGRIDLVIHAAGVSQRSLAEETNMVVYRRLMELNFFAPVAITKALLPFFRAQGGGQIAVISSMAGLIGFPMRTGYAAAKHALKGFFETLQTEHNIPNFYITLAYPGRINTPISLHALTRDGSPHGIMDKGQREGIPVEACASRIVKAIKRKKRFVLIARQERLLFWLWFLVPSAYHAIARRIGLRDV